MYYIDKSLHIISIHALRKECDYFYADNVIWVQISIHALRKECDIALINADMPFCKFLSTHSVRSATFRKHSIQHIVKFLSTHSVRSATYAAIKIHPFW